MKWICVTSALVAITALGCTSLFSPTVKGSGVSATENRVVGEFDGVAASGSIHVVVTTAPERTCAVTGDDNVLPLVKTEIDGTTLKVYVEGSYTSVVPLEVNVTAPNLEALSQSGSGMLTASGLKGDTLKIKREGSGAVRVTGLEMVSLEGSTSGSGSLTLNEVKTRDANLALTGSGEIVARGSAQNLNLQQTGSGDSRLEELCVLNGAVNLTGSGDSTVSVSQALRAEVTGSGNISCLGEPSLAISRDVTGSGNVRLVGSGVCAEPSPAQPVSKTTVDAGVPAQAQ